MRRSASFTDHIARCDPPTRRMLQQLRRTIRAAAPGTTETVRYGIPTFQLNGKNLVHFAGYEHHIGFYPGPGAMCKWLPPKGFTGSVQHMDARVGGTYKMSFTNFGTGQSHSFGGTYLELVPNERICNTDSFDDPKLPGTMKTIVTLKRVSCGTELTAVQEGVPDSIPPEMCYLGWQESLDMLADLVEPEIPG